MRRRKSGPFFWPMKKTNSFPLVRLARGGLLTAVLATLSGCGGVLDPQGPVGDAQKHIILDALAIMMCVIVPTIIATLAFAWWYREGNTKARYQPTFAYSGRIELVTWAVPILIILFLAGLTWISSHELDPFKKLPVAANRKTLDVQVVSLDWKWLFIYPDQHIAAVNELTVPAGAPVHFTLTSASVLNSFFVPQLGSMIYSMNGMSTELNLQANKTGNYYGLSTHFSGDGFPGMSFNLHAVTDQQFAAWVKSVQADGPMLDRASYAELSKQSLNVKPYTYRSAEPGLYEDIVTQKIPSGPGPQEGNPGPDVKPTTTITRKG